MTDSRVTCPSCLRRLAMCPINEHGFALVGEVFDVGHIAKPQMGHQFYHCTDGPTALCIARTLERGEQITPTPTPLPGENKEDFVDRIVNPEVRTMRQAAREAAKRPK